MKQWLGFFLLSTLVLLAFWMLRRRAQTAIDSSQHTKRTDDGDSLPDDQFSRLVPRVFLLSLCAWMAVWWWLILPTVASNFGFTASADEIEIFVERKVWLVPGVLLGFVVGWMPVDVACSLRYGDLYARLLAGERLLSYPTPIASVSWVAGFAVAANLALLPIGAWHERFGEREVVARSIFSLSAVSRSYGEVETIKISSRFESRARREEIHRPALAIEFTDGYKWTSVDSVGKLTASQMAQLADFVASRANVAIEEKPLLSRRDLR